MVLSVIVPDKRKGMKHMLLKELQNIDSEIIISGWRDGLVKAQGDFICLLEHDSAVSPGSIAKQLKPFLDNPRFRKLVMVSPLVEFDDSEAMSLSGFQNHSEYPQMTRVGCVPGAVIRRTSLLKYVDLLDNHVSDLSYEVSVAFWENGLRITGEPTCVYYSPSSVKKGGAVVVSTALQKLWQRECIV